MRWGIAIVLAGCASGGTPGTDVDGSVPTDSAATCGEPGLLPCVAIHVATTGLDTNNGADDSPMKTITAAIARAATVSPVLPVFIQQGVYEETITMRAGIDLYGGFDPSWQRTPGAVTTIDGGAPAVTFENLEVATKLDGVTVTGADATTAGSSAIAILIIDSQAVELVEVNVEAGFGGGGADGADGGIGGSGTNGSIGKAGVERSTAFLCDNRALPTGGAPGTSVCGRTGGTGGTPGVGDSGSPAGHGNAGLPGTGGTPGGPGAPGESQDGSPGSPGSPGAPGNNGAAGLAAGTFTRGVYAPARGSDGTDGGFGNGGGGGGGGGGGTTDCDSTGSSGGGGGGGGCGGGFGHGGGGGGGSFGIVAVDSTVIIRSSTVTSSRGGDGGSGGNGGGGGAGGSGGPGGPYGGSSEQDDGGDGAPGGKGGAGGRGGHGGGGGGGPSAAVVCVGSAAVTVPQTMLSPGTGGMGGTSLGNAGATGSSSAAIGCSFF